MRFFYSPAPDTNSIISVLNFIESTTILGRINYT